MGQDMMDPGTVPIAMSSNSGAPSGQQGGIEATIPPVSVDKLRGLATKMYAV